MYDTHADTNGMPDAAEVQAGGLRMQRGGANSPGGFDQESAIEIVALESDGAADDERDELGVAVRSQMRDNLALGQTLVSFGLMDASELTKVDLAQRRETDVVDSLLVTSTIRSRLGEILLRARQITSNQLERALEIQRTQGGLLGEILVERGWIVPHSLQHALALQQRT
jgi:hypothetical protein